MKEYNKEMLDEYVKELFALCLGNKNVTYFSISENEIIQVRFKTDKWNTVYSNLHKTMFAFKNKQMMPVWELIEILKEI